MRNFSRVVVYMGNVNPVSRNFAARGYYPGVVSSNFSDEKREKSDDTIGLSDVMAAIKEMPGELKEMGGAVFMPSFDINPQDRFNFLVDNEYRGGGEYKSIPKPLYTTGTVKKDKRRVRSAESDAVREIEEETPNERHLLHAAGVMPLVL